MRIVTMIKSKEVIDDVQQGRMARKLRRSKGILAKFVAEKMGASKTLICLLEQGKRHWSKELVAAYSKAIGDDT